MFNRRASLTFRAHRVEHGKVVTAADHNMLSIDVDAAHDRLDNVRNDLSEHTLGTHVSKCDVDSLRRRVSDLETDNIMRPTGADVEKSAIGGMVAGGLFVLAGVLIIKAIAGAASSEATK
jgi:CBS-domain-containing membrane protein